MSINISPPIARGRLSRFNTELQSAVDALAPIETQINNYVGETALHSVAYNSHKGYLRDGHLPLLREKRNLYECLIERNTNHIGYINQYLYDAPYFDSNYIAGTIAGLRSLIMLANIAGISTEGLEQMLSRWIDRQSRFQDFVSVTNDIYSDAETALRAVETKLVRLIFALYCSGTQTFTTLSLEEVTEKMDWMRSMGLLDIYIGLFTTTNPDTRRTLFVELFTLLYNSKDPELTDAILNIIKEHMTFEDRMAMIYNAELSGHHERFGGGQRNPLHLFFGEDGEGGDEMFIAFIEGLLGTTCHDEIDEYLNNFWTYGCSHVAMANAVFVEFSNRPDEFESTFGFPMYTVDEQGIRFNFEYISIDIFEFHGTQRGTNPTTRQTVFVEYLESRGVVANITNERHSVDDIEEVFQNTLQDGQQLILRQRPTIVYEMDGTTERFRGAPDGGHAVTVTGITEDGNIIVSTWGQEALVRPIDYLEDSHILDFEIMTFE